MNSVRRVIRKGVTLNTVYTEKFKTNYFSVNFVFPLVPEEVPYYSLFSQILRRGTRRYPSVAEMSRRLEELYASEVSCRTGLFGENEVFTVSADMLRNRCLDEKMDLTAEVIDYVAEVLSHPLLSEYGKNFREDIIEAEVRHLRDIIRAKINNKTAYAADRCRSLMCEGEPYAADAVGTEEALDALNLSAAYRYYQRLFREARIEIFFVGDESPERVEALLQPILSLFPERETALVLPETVKAPAAPRDFEEIADTVQSKLCMGFRVTRDAFVDERTLSSMFLSVFSASPVSKLFIHVREEKSLCYYCNMRIEFLKGVGFVNAGISADKKDETVSAVMEQLSEMQKGNITDEELFAARSFLMSSLSYTEDSAEAIEGFLLKNALLEKPDVDIEAMKAHLDKITKDEIARMARNVVLDTVYLLKANGKEECDGEA